MDANWQSGEEGRWWQIGHSSCFRVGDAHSTDVSGLLSLLFIRFFLSPSPLKPCGYCTCLIMMKHVPFSSNLSAIVWFVLCNDLRDLQAWRKCKLAFSSLGWRCGGWVYNNKYQNEYQMAEPCMRLLYLLDNYETRTFLTQPLHHRIIDSFTRNVHRDLQACRKCKLAGTSEAWTIQW